MSDSSPLPLPPSMPMPMPMPMPAATGWDGHLHVFDGRPLPAGHYQAPNRTLADWAALAAPLGLGRGLLVQPSVLGSDNALLLQALASAPGRHRGVVVLAGDETDAALDRMAEAGVRGMRLNLVSPPGLYDDAAALLGRLAPRLRARGWFVQWYAPPAQWGQVAALSAQHGLLPVLDHLAGVTPAVWAAGTVLRDLAPLADLGGWLKLSGWYRLQASPPYDTLLPAIDALQGLFAGRCLWGSDWPHTRFMEPGVPGPVPSYASLLQPLHQALGATAAQAVLHDAPARLLA